MPEFLDPNVIEAATKEKHAVPPQTENLPSQPAFLNNPQLSAHEALELLANFKKKEIPPTEPFERITPEQCHVLEPARVFAGSTEAQAFFDQMPDEAEIIVLPWMMEGATLHNKGSLQTVLRDYGEGTDRDGYDKSTYPLAVSLIDTGGKQRYAVLLSESPNIQPQPAADHRRYYRDSSASSLEAMREHGLYQLPGRYCLRGSREQTGEVPADGRAIISFDLPNQYLMTNDPEKLSAVAVGFNHPSLGEELPTGLQRELWLFDGRENQGHIIRYKDLKQQVLPWGDAGGMLVRVDATGMQVDIIAQNSAKSQQIAK